MARENAPFQQHTWGDFAFRLLLRCSSEKICCLMGFGRVDKVLVSFAAVIKVVTRHATLLLSGEKRCVTSDDPNNGCEGD